MDQPQDESMSGQIVGSFRLVRLLGEGGMSSVYLAARTGEFEQWAAVKLLREGLRDAGTRQRFRAEQQALASLRHPDIVQIVDGGVTAGGVPYLVMDYIDGVPLDVYCGEHALPVRSRIALTIRVLDAVEYAHQRFLAHCDLKFSNILVTPEGAPRLLDFGVTKLLEPALFGVDGEATRADARPFTPEFASPEQLQGRSLAAATDIYSAGVCLYILLAGEHPFESVRDQPIALLRATISAEPPPPSVRAPQLRGDLDAIMLKALRKEPELRYAGAAQFAADLRNYLEGRPVEARRGSRRYRAWKFVKRHRTAAAAAGLSIAALLAGGGGALWQSVRAQRSRAVAESRFEDASKLTGSLLVESFQAVQKLEGSGPLQRSLIDQSRLTLDRLAAQSTDDPALAAGLADTYWKLGNLQLGQPAEAAASFGRGLELAGAALRRNAGNRDALLAKARLLESRSGVERALGQLEDSKRDAALAVEVRAKAK